MIVFENESVIEFVGYTPYHVRHFFRITAKTDFKEVLKKFEAQLCVYVTGPGCELHYEGNHRWEFKFTICSD